MDAFPTPKDPLIGMRLDGRYLITGVLGRGGMGVVYDGVHEALGRPVAIKVLSAAIAAEQVVVQRFLREARIAAGLGHGNIVDVSDLGRLPDGRPYLVMPKVTGIAFSDLLARHGPQSPSRVVELLRGVAAALDLVHAKKLVHRDVKPENLMFVVREDGSETVMLMDFGIATLLSPSTVRLTGEGVVCGTPGYIAPESARGEDADHRADVYALATVAFELLTGELPFDAANPLRILPMKAFRDPPRLGERCDRSFPQALETVIARGLARTPEQRYETAGAFVRALELAIDPLAATRNSLPPTQVLATPKPPRITESLELPAGTSDEFEFDLASADGASPAAGPPAPAAPDLAAAEQMDTQLTPRSSPSAASAPVVSSAASPAPRAEPLPPSPAASAPSTPPKIARSRRGLFGVLTAMTFVGAGLAFAGFWPVPPPAPTTPPKSAPEPTHHVAPLPSVAPPPTPIVQMPTAAPPPTPPAPQPPPRTPRSNPKPTHRALPSAPAPSPAPSPPSPAPAPSLAPSPSPALPTAEDLSKQAGQALLQGHLARAAELFAQATARDSRSAAAWRGLGLTSERLGRTREAIRAYKRALQLAPTGPQADSVRARLEQLK